MKPAHAEGLVGNRHEGRSPVSATIDLPAFGCNPELCPGQESDYNNVQAPTQFGNSIVFLPEEHD